MAWADGPTYDREMLSPTARWYRTTEFSVKLPVEFANPVTITVGNPPGRFGFKGLPVFVARVSITEFGSVHHPYQPSGSLDGRDGSNVSPYCNLERIDIRLGKPVFESKDRLFNAAQNADCLGVSQSVATDVPAIHEAPVFITTKRQTRHSTMQS